MYLPYILSDLFESSELDIDTLKSELDFVYTRMVDEQFNCIANVADELIDLLRPYKAIYRASKPSSTKHVGLIVEGHYKRPMKFWLIK